MAPLSVTKSAEYELVRARVGEDVSSLSDEMRRAQLIDGDVIDV